MTEIQFSDIWKNQTIQHFELFQDKERFFHSFAWAVAGRSHYLLRKRLTLLQLPPADFDWYENLKDMIKIENMIKDNSWSIHFRVNKDWIPLSANKRIVSKCKCLERLHKLYFQFDSQCTILFWNSGNSNFIKGFTDMPDQKDSCTGLVDLFVTDRFHARLSTAVFLNHRLIYIYQSDNFITKLCCFWLKKVGTWNSCLYHNLVKTSANTLRRACSINFD